MAGQFESRPDGGAAIALDEVEVSILRSLAVQLLELLGPGDQPAGDGAESDPLDPLDALFVEGPSEPPSDPVLARLFPDAYGGPRASGEPPAPEEERSAVEASAEFRRYTENDLRARKRADGLAMVHALNRLSPEADGGAVLTLAPEDSRHWLGALNDLRLAIGTRLEVADDEDGGGLYRLPDSDPRKPMVMAYLWLGGLQETLIETLLP